MILLNKKEICILNFNTVQRHGGNFVPPNNFLHEENLDYLLEAVVSSIFGEEAYPTIPEKASVYCFNIICNHIFSDGNKRTGLASAHQFLRLNHFDFVQSVSNDILINFITEVASGKYSLDQCKQWFIENTMEIK
jgi:death on curing protein